VPGAGPEHLFERAGTPQPIARGSRGFNAGCNADQTERRARPFARRADNTLRPPTVFMRARKPCVRARRIFDGWNVRFMADLEALESIPRRVPMRDRMVARSRRRFRERTGFRESETLLATALVKRFRKAFY
jgi:hypothetical protein